MKVLMAAILIGVVALIGLQVFSYPATTKPAKSTAQTEQVKPAELPAVATSATGRVMPEVSVKPAPVSIDWRTVVLFTAVIALAVLLYRAYATRYLPQKSEAPGETPFGLVQALLFRDKEAGIEGWKAKNSGAILGSWQLGSKDAPKWSGKLRHGTEGWIATNDLKNPRFELGSLPNDNPKNEPTPAPAAA